MNNLVVISFSIISGVGFEGERIVMHFGKVLLIANPAAQRGNGAKAATAAHEQLSLAASDASVELTLTERPGHATEIAAQASVGSYDTVVALGGDGVVHEIANGLMKLPADARPRFGVIPVGSGNDYARTLGMSETVSEAIQQLAAGHEVAADVGCCNGEHFVETLSFGLDAAIALDTVERRKRTGEQGTILYLKSGLDQLLHHLELYAFEAVLDGEAPSGAARVLKDRVHMFAVQVGPTYGGGFRICPEASITDGKLDICYASGPMNMLEATFKFLSAKDAHHTKFENIHFDRASSIELTFDRRPPCQIDGEPHVADSYSISIVPVALRVITRGQ